MLEVITGCMYCGKTEELVRRLRRCKIAGQHIIAFKPAIDNRYSKNDIASHPIDGSPSETFRAIPVHDVSDIRAHLNQAPFCWTGEVIGVDEVQFMDPEIVAILEEQANRGRRVIVAGLDLDSNGNAFGPMAELLVKADNVLKLTAVCVAHAPEREGPCGKPATRSFRIPEQSTGETVQVGSAGVYEARCRTCWAKGMGKA